jgi:Flp pilus assembly protein TadD
VSIIERLRTLLETGNDSAQLRFGLASALFARAEYAEAREHARVAVQLDPDYSAAWRLLGRSHHELGDFDSAARAFESGIAVAERRGDRQLVKEMGVFLARARKAAGRDAGEA